MLAQILGSGILIQANVARHPDELRDCGHHSRRVSARSRFLFGTMRRRSNPTSAILGHSVMLLTHVFVIALCRHHRESATTRFAAKDERAAMQSRAQCCSAGWLAIFFSAHNSHGISVRLSDRRDSRLQFLRNDPLRGNFYEAVWHALRHLFF